MKKYHPIPLNTARARFLRRARSFACRAGRLLYDLRTKLATVAVAALAVLLALHVIFGANGMMVYQQKKAEFRSLQEDVGQLERENQALSDQIRALKTDPNAIEKEAREQLHYARPGEIIYLTPEQPNSDTSSPNASAKK